MTIEWRPLLRLVLIIAAISLALVVELHFRRLWCRPPVAQQRGLVGLVFATANVTLCAAAILAGLYLHIRY